MEPIQEYPKLINSNMPAGFTFSLYGNRWLTVPISQMVEVRNNEINFSGSESGRQLVQEALDKLTDFFCGLPATFDVVFLQTQNEIKAIGLSAPYGITPVGSQLEQSDGNPLVAYIEQDHVRKLCALDKDLSPEQYKSGFLQEVGHGYHSSAIGMGGPFWLAEGVANAAVGNYSGSLPIADRVDFRPVQIMDDINKCNGKDWFPSATNFVCDVVSHFGKEKLIVFLQGIKDKRPCDDITSPFNNVYSCSFDDSVENWLQGKPFGGC